MVSTNPGLNTKNLIPSPLYLATNLDIKRLGAILEIAYRIATYNFTVLQIFVCHVR